MVKDNKLYKTLEVSENASEADIKKAYKKLAIKHHPDKNRDNKEAAAEKFKEISEAYQILSDPEKRKMYDQLGMDGVNGSGMQFNPNDLFENLFGGMGGFPFAEMFGQSSGGRTREKVAEPVMIKKKVSLEEIYLGKEIEVEYPQTSHCSECNGSGSKSGISSKCDICNGSGIRNVIQQIGPGMIQQFQKTCDACDGEGFKIDKKDRCKFCKGSGLTRMNVNVKIPLKKGVMEGQKITLEGQGNQIRNSNYRSDLIVVIIEKQNKHFKRDGDDLHFDMNIKLFQALCGFNKIIPFFGDKNLVIKSDNVIQTGDIKVLDGKGMPNIRTEIPGNMIIHFTVEFPKNIRERLQNNNLALLKKILICSKDESKENDNDESIGKIVDKIDELDKLNLELCELEDFNINLHQQNNSSEESGQPQCVQQ
jgi:DnaJ family protein A protein 2